MNTATQARKRENSLKAMAKILVVDDHPIVRHGLTRLIAQADDMEVCGEAQDGATALTLIESLAPDLVTVDLALPGDVSGINLISQLTRDSGGPKVLVVSMMDHSLYGEQVLECGATGYVEKERTTEQLLDAIREVLRGGMYLPAAMRDLLLTRAATKRSSITDPILKLSERETQVFGLIGQGLTTDQIATQLTVSPKTVHTYRQHIMAKLSLSTSSQLIVRAAAWISQQPTTV